MATNYTNSAGVARVTVNRNKEAPTPTPRTTARPSAQSAQGSRRAVTVEDIHALAARHAADAKALAQKAAYAKGYALAAEACRAARSLGWGAAPISVTQSKSATGLPLVLTFAKGNRATVNANMTISLLPSAKG